MTTALVLFLAYLLGSVPFGLLLTRLAGTTDLRTIGSGNIGATNVLRTGRKGLAAATLLLDMGKGSVAVLLAHSLAPGSEPLAGLAALFGHIFPVWLRFKGGKGVATAFGIMLVFHWPTALLAALTWLASAALLRFSSASALIALASTPVYASILARSDLVLITLAMAALVTIRHYDNILRLVKGTEPKIGKHTSP